MAGTGREQAGQHSGSYVGGNAIARQKIEEMRGVAKNSSQQKIETADEWGESVQRQRLCWPGPTDSAQTLWRPMI
jgi:hypothetical protein